VPDIPLSQTHCSRIGPNADFGLQGCTTGSAWVADAVQQGLLQDRVTSAVVVNFQSWEATNDAAVSVGPSYIGPRGPVAVMNLGYDLHLYLFVAQACELGASTTALNGASCETSPHFKSFLQNFNVLLSFHCILANST
jgi:hypothetical protein